MSKTIERVRRRDHITRIVADIHGVSTDYVRRIRNGERNNEEIMATLVDYQIASEKLIKHLEKLVPIKPNPEKYARKKN